jgi:hypothetical protein
MSAGRIRRVVWSTIAISLAGCTVDLNTYKISGDSDPDHLEDGAIPYILPKTQFVVSASYVVDCKESTDKKSDATVSITPTFTVTPTSIPDEHERYYIKYTDLQNWLKDSKISLSTNPNQTLSSVNGTINDLAGPTIATAIGAAIAIAGTASVVGVPAIGAGALEATQEIQSQPTKPPMMCKDYLKSSVITALNDVKKLKSEISTLQKAHSSSSSSTNANDAKIAQDATQVTKIIADKLTINATMSWDPTPPGAQNKPVQVVIDGSSLVKEWFISNPGFDTWIANTDIKRQMVLDLLPWSVAQNGPEVVDTVVKGFVVRNPAIGTLRICKTTCPSLGQNLTKTNDQLAIVQNVSIPQLGARMILPFSDQIFQNNSLNITLASDGTITSLGTQQTGTAGTTLSALTTDAQAAGSAIAARNTAIGARNTAIQAVTGYADTVNKSLADCLQQQQTIVKYGGTPTVNCQ